MSRILMPIPDLITALTLQRDEALAALAAKAGQHQTMTNQLEQASRALQALAGEHQVALDELRALRIWKSDVALAADQQHANEPDTAPWDQHAAMASFTADDPFPTTTGHVMPATALRHDKQTIGLLW